MSRININHNNFKTSLDSLRSHKSRSFWTMLGVIIGVASVITVIGIGEGVKQQVSGQLHKYGKDIIVIKPAQIRAGGDTAHAKSTLSDISVSGYLSAKDITTVKGTKGVADSAPLTIVSGKVTGDNGLYNKGFVIGTTPDLSRLLNQSVSDGSFLVESDMGGNAAVLGKEAANEMFNETVPLGHTFTFQGREFVVRGIFNDFPTSPLSQQANFDNAVFIPNDVAQDMTKNTAPTYQIIARGSDPNKAEETAAAIRKELDRTHGGVSNLSVLVGDENINSSNSILNLLTGLVAGVAAISLLVGGLGIMNVMLVSVTERMHEIGIRKAIGATNKQILHQFLLESSLLTLIGAVIGIAISYITALMLGIYTDLKPSISFDVVLGVTAISLVIGVLFGTIPALQAARKDPIEALRSGNL